MAYSPFTNPTFVKLLSLIGIIFLTACNDRSEITDRLDRLETKQKQISKQCVLETLTISSQNRLGFPEIVVEGGGRHRDLLEHGDTDFVLCPPNTNVIVRLSLTEKPYPDEESDISPSHFAEINKACLGFCPTGDN